MEYKYEIMLRRHALKRIQVPVRAKRAGSDRPSHAKELLRKWLTKGEECRGREWKYSRDLWMAIVTRIGTRME